MKIVVSIGELVPVLNKIVTHIKDTRIVEDADTLQDIKEKNYRPARTRFFGLIKLPERILTDSQAAEIAKYENIFGWHSEYGYKHLVTARYLIDACEMSLTNYIELDRDDIEMLSWWKNLTGEQVRVKEIIDADADAA